MPVLDLRRFLRRLRPAGGPGAPAGAAVPADRLAQIAAELEPVFAALTGTQAECAEIQRRAIQGSDQLMRAARAEASRLAGEAQRRASLEAAKVRETRAREAQAARAAVLTAATGTAELIEERSRQQIPRLATEVLDTVRLWARTAGGDTGTGEGGPEDGTG